MIEESLSPREVEHPEKGSMLHLVYSVDGQICSVDQKGSVRVSEGQGGIIRRQQIFTLIQEMIIILVNLHGL